jgi:hypothetical protein
LTAPHTASMVADGKENATPRLPSQSCSECDHVVPCSQSSLRAGGAACKEGLAGRCVFYLPPALVRLLRWLVTSSWRLFDGPVGCRPAGDSRSDLVAANDGELLALVADTMSILQVPLCLSVCLDVGEWTALDLRAGWGREGEAAAVLRRFVSAAEGGRGAVLGSAVKSIALFGAEAAESSRPAGVLAPVPATTWLILAIGAVAREGYSASVDVAGTANGRLPPLLEAVEDCAVGADRRQSSVALSTMLDVLGHLPAHWLFNSCSHDVVAQHLSRTVAPALWPLSSSVVRTLVRSYLGRSASNGLSTASAGEPPIVLLAGLALRWESVSALSVIARALESSSGPAFVARAKDVWTLSRAAMGTLGRDGGMLGASDAPVSFGDVSWFAQVIQRDPVAAAASLVFMPYIASQREPSFSLVIWRVRLRAFLHSLVGTGDVAVAGMLDVAADFAARAPLAAAYRHDAKKAAEAGRWSTVCLEEVIAARLRLLHVADAPGLRLSGSDDDDDEDVLSGARAAGAGLGLRGHRPRRCFNSDVDGWDENGPPVDGDSALLSKVVKGRLAAAVGGLNDSAFSLLVESVHCGASATLVLRLVDVAVLVAHARKGTARGGGLQNDLASSAGLLAVFPGIERGIHASIDRCRDLSGRLEPSQVNPELRRLNPTLWGRLTSE